MCVRYEYFMPNSGHPRVRQRDQIEANTGKLKFSVPALARVRLIKCPP